MEPKSQVWEDISLLKRLKKREKERKREKKERKKRKKGLTRNNSQQVLK